MPRPFKFPGQTILLVDVINNDGFHGADLASPGFEGSQEPPNATQSPSLQAGEITVVSTGLQRDVQDFSLGSAVGGGQYSVAVKCEGREESTQVPWNGGTDRHQGRLEVNGTPEGPVTRHGIELPDHAKGVSFRFEGLRDGRFTVSIATAGNQPEAASGICPGIPPADTGNRLPSPERLAWHKSEER